MLNRTIAPPIKDAKEFNLQLPLYKKQVLSNGVEVFAIDLGTEDALMITWVFDAGNSYEERNGIAAAVLALALGTPLSVTRITILLVLGPCDSSGVQEKNPLAGSMVAPAGAPGSRLKVSDCAGKSGSVAEAVKVRSAPSATV